MKKNLSHLSLAYLTIERNPPPYFSGADRIRENLSPEYVNLRRRLELINRITSWQIKARESERAISRSARQLLIGPILKETILAPLTTRIIIPVRKLLTEFSVPKYLLLFAISFICLGIMALYSIW